MIISASRRTDLPAFGAAEFAADFRRGFTLVGNPFRPKLVRQVSLLPDEIEAVFFWTRNPEPLLPFLPEMQALGLPVFFLYTLTGYGAALEPRAPASAISLERLARLAGLLGRERISWRYDPIILTESTPLSFHLANFSRLLELVAPHVSRIIVSLFQPYTRALARLKRAGFIPETPGAGQLEELGRGLVKAAGAYHLPLQACALPPELSLPGIEAGKCLDPGLLAATGRPGPGYRKDPGQRRDCLCQQAVDIGRYHTCGHGCLYCYAC